jgi:hypothetical protein
MKPELLEKLADGIVAAVKAHVTARLAPLEENVRGLIQRCDAQAARIAALEAKLAEQESKAEPTERWLRAI